MIIKSWHNYSVKLHSDPKRKQKMNNRKKYEANESLNDSCASDVAEAIFEKLPPTGKRYVQRKGMMENNLKTTNQFQFKMMPNIQEHYKADKKAKRKSYLPMLPGEKK